MPNWCDTSYKCVGDLKEVKSLHKVLKYMEKRKTSILPNGTWQDFNNMNDAAKALDMNPGCIANNLKSKGVCNNGYRFKTTASKFPQP